MNRTRTRTAALLTATALTTALTGCSMSVDIGPQASEEHPLDGDVTSIVLETSGTLRLARGDEPSLTVSAGERTLERLTTELRDGVLTLSAERGAGLVRVGGLGEITYDVVLPELVELQVRGSGEVEGDDVTGESLTLTVEGSGDVELESVDLDTLDLRISGSGDVALAGRTRAQQVSIDGSGQYDGAALASSQAIVTVQGSGDARVDVTDRLQATVAGSGEVLHSGGAQVTEDVSGSGDVDEA